MNPAGLCFIVMLTAGVTLVLLCFGLALLCKYPVCSQVGPPPLSPLAKSARLVMLQGWKASLENGQHVFEDTAKTTDDCIEKCRQAWSCRFVTFDLNQKRCWGMSGLSNVRFSRDPTYVLQADSAKVFVKKNATAYPGNSLMVGNQRAADDTWDDTICMTLCHIHPRCNVVDYNSVIGWCTLKEKLVLNPKMDAAHTSYIS